MTSLKLPLPEAEVTVSFWATVWCPRPRIRKRTKNIFLKDLISQTDRLLQAVVNLIKAIRLKFTTLGYFKVRYEVVIYDHRAFIRLTTGLIVVYGQRRCRTRSLLELLINVKVVHVCKIWLNFCVVLDLSQKSKWLFQTIK